MSWLTGISNFVKRNKGKTAVGVGGALGLGYLATRQDEPQTPTQETPPVQEKQSTTQPPQKQKHISNKSVGKETINNTPPQQDEMPRFLQILSTINEEAQKHAQVFELATQKYLEANQVYEEKLNELLPTITLFSAKTSFRDLTKEDLPKIVGEYLKNVPYGAGIQSLNKLIKGYYVLRLNGVDTEGLSPIDIIQAGENPAFVENTHEAIIKSLEHLGSIIQLRMKQNLDTIGILRDNYKAIRDELNKKAELYMKALKYANDFLLDKEKMALEWASLEERKRHNRTMEGLGYSRLALQREKFEYDKTKPKSEGLNSLLQSDKNPFAE